MKGERQLGSIDILLLQFQLAFIHLFLLIISPTNDDDNYWNTGLNVNTLPDRQNMNTVRRRVIHDVDFT